VADGCQRHLRSWPAVAPDLCSIGVASALCTCQHRRAPLRSNLVRQCKPLSACQKCWDAKAASASAKLVAGEPSVCPALFAAPDQAQNESVWAHSNDLGNKRRRHLCAWSSTQGVQHALQTPPVRQKHSVGIQSPGASHCVAWHDYLAIGRAHCTCSIAWARR
jgi:hypothetical protein